MRYSILLLCMCLSCGSAGKYGYSRMYSPLSEEEDATEGAKEYDPVMVERFPEEWKGTVSVFGVVTRRAEAPGGLAHLTLSVRTLAPRNLCDEPSEETCRVTVSDREHALVHAHVKLDSEALVGESSVGVGSLVRVVGKLGDAVDEGDGNRVLKGTYLRHWPVHQFVTTADASHMRR